MEMHALESITKILANYTPDEYVQAEHDELFLGGPKPSELSEDDAKALDDLGCLWDEEYECWKKFT